MQTPITIQTPHPGDGRTLLTFKSGVCKLGRRWGGRPRQRKHFRHEIVSMLTAWIVVLAFFVLLAIGLYHL